MSGYLIFGGIDSRDYDVFVSFSDIDTVPRRVYTKVDIVGKNGSVLIDEGKYEDVPHSYDCIVLDNEKRVAFVNAIMSKKGYQRLTDSYGTDEYYTAVLEENIEQKTTRIRDKYKFKLIFTRKPQRFLTSGEEPVDTSELGGEVTTDKIPYLFRRSGGGNIGHDFDAEIDKIIGGTVAWNQLVQNGNFANTDNWTANRGTLTVSGNVGTYTCTESHKQGRIYQSFNAIKDHKYYVSCYVKGSEILNPRLSIGDGSAGIDFTNVPANTKVQISGMTTWGATESTTIALRPNYTATAMTVNATVKISNFICVDLTALFGSAEIADYVYSLEQTTAGAGIAWLKAHFPKMFDTYHAYNEGSLLSVKTSEHRTVGFNALNPNADKIKGNYNLEVGAVLPSTSPTASTSGTNPISVVVSNAWDMVTFISDELIANNIYTADYTITGSTDNSKVRGTVYLIDDTYTVVEKIRVIQGSSGLKYTDVFTPSKTGLKFALTVSSSPAQTLTIEDLCVHLGEGEYEPYHINSYPLDSDLELRGLFKLDANNNLYADGDVYESSGAVTREYGIRAYQSGDESLADAITDGTNTVYKLTTPTTEQADPYANPQVVNPLGTEEYIDTRDVPVPVGHETKYGMSQPILTNPTDFPSKPLLEVTGVGTFWLGDTLFTITGTAGQTIYIDCETGEAWKNTGGIITPANGLVTLNKLDFPELDPGDTPVIYGTGITKVVVTPRWWRL